MTSHFRGFGEICYVHQYSNPSMDIISFFEMSVSFYQAARCHSQEDSNLHIHRCGNLKPHTALLHPQSIQTDQVSRNFYFKPTVPCIITPCISEPATFQRNASPPLSGLKQQAMSVYIDFLFGLLFDPDDGSGTFLRNIRLSPNYKKAVRTPLQESWNFAQMCGI